MILIIDYGMSNLRSVRHALHYLGAEACITDSPRDINRARALVLPGDGAFGPAMENLGAGGWLEPIYDAIARGVPFLGICLGMQLLFDSSEEMGEHRGLGILRGCVKKFPSDVGKIPQIGWNELRVRNSSKFLQGVPDGVYAYFVHSYYCEAHDAEVVAAQTEYGISYASVIESGNVWGAQFHPEKSGHDGLRMLRNFLELVNVHNLSRD
ncbi:MAG TPA: imidazole glycerol phosphate synthase subunit HisH [Anaerolineae bacterium]|nr:imidazole glycerol phosphate synthase subunit HisH [Anaerolineae bacterium]